MKTRPFSAVARILPAGGSLGMLVFAIQAASAAHPLDQLQLQYPLPVFAELNNAAHGNGTYVLVGSSGVVVTSSDAVTWQVEDAGTTVHLVDVIFANNQFVAVGGGRCFTSADGSDWTETSSTLGNTDGGITFGDGLYMVVGASGNIASSVNLIDWTTEVTGDTTRLRAVAHGEGRFVAVGDGGLVAQRATSGNWVLTSETTARLNGVVHGNGLFVACGHSGTILTSADGIDWTDHGSIGASALFAIQFGGGVFVASGNHVGSPAYAIYRSTNGTDWSGVNSTQLDQFLDGGGYGNGRFVLLGRNYIQVSSDGSVWDFASDGPMFVPRWAEYLNGGFIGVHGGSIYGNAGYSTDGVHWTAQDTGSTGFTGGHLDATTANGNFLVCGRNNQSFIGYILLTRDGVDWSLAYSTPTVGGIWGIDFGNSQYLACGEGGRILFSDDAVDWEQKRHTGGIDNLRGMAHGAGLYVVVGDNGRILTSPDGTVWTLRDSGVTSRLEDVIFHNGRFVAVAQNSNTMITSTDGIDWDPIGTMTSFAPQRIKLVNGELVVPGLVSADGLTWNAHNFGGEVVFTGTAYFTFGSTILSAPAGGIPPMLDSIARQGDEIVIEWSTGGVLQSRPGVGIGNWQDVNGAGNPHRFSNPGGLIEIFRLRSE